MQKADGHRIVETTVNASVRIADCTRWEEIKDCVNYHVQMAALAEAPTEFRLLNKSGGVAQEFSVAVSGPAYIQQDVKNATNIMRKARPGGVTPLTRHIKEIHKKVSSMAPQLNAEGKRVAIIIATDGLPTDERGQGGTHVRNEFVQSLRSLEGLPVWVVIRLCTDEDSVVEFYDALDQQLEISLELLDDFIGEAKEIYAQNTWLNYALPLHRLREMGFHDRIFDLLDERAFTKSEVRDFCYMLFGEEHFDGVPDPVVDWAGFVEFITELLKKEKPKWNPMLKRRTPWIDINRLNQKYGGVRRKSARAPARAPSRAGGNNSSICELCTIM
uniref:VWFA domain-containing protein n=1 Tax=Ditylum brightwellii TaxID=49249 RepID=A0A6U3RGZ2_9STRA|mmetsp:Transcript_25920/g.38528  ORF Transcript_25920/g.38528 Transcript_25920/m.38528 type:complete len:330 (+) Transcript_25920:615-1604(+)